MNMKIFFLILCFPYLLLSRQIETFYGPLEVEEPVLLELIDSDAFQRLKSIHQYGVAYYITYKENYTRYEHSIGVFAVLRSKGIGLEGQIAGLLHDVSHTAFSHVGDWIFNRENNVKDYQNTIHADFLEESGLGSILRKYNFSIDQVLPIEELHPALENSLPNLCADRIDYNIQGAFYQNFITYEEALLAFKDLEFIQNRWVSHTPELMKKLTRFSLFMTQNCWGSPTNYLTSRWLADAILRGVELGDITFSEIHFGADQLIWEKLIQHRDPVIQTNIHKVLNHTDYFTLIDSFEDADLFIKSKFRGINPWISTDTEVLRLTEVDEEIQKEFTEVKQKVEKGWPVKLFPYN